MLEQFVSLLDLVFEQLTLLLLPLCLLGLPDQLVPHDCQALTQLRYDAIVSLDLGLVLLEFVVEVFDLVILQVPLLCRSGFVPLLLLGVLLVLACLQVGESHRDTVLLQISHVLEGGVRHSIEITSEHSNRGLRILTIGCIYYQ